MARRRNGNGNGNGSAKGVRAYEPGRLALRAADRLAPGELAGKDRALLRTAGNVAGGLVAATLLYRLGQWAWTWWKKRPAPTGGK